MKSSAQMAKTWTVSWPSSNNAVVFGAAKQARRASMDDRCACLMSSTSAAVVSLMRPASTHKACESSC